MTDCTVEGCESQVLARGYCGKHYTRFRKHGNPHTVLVSSTVLVPGHPLRPLHRLTGEDHPTWRGDEASYAAIHQRLVVRRGKASEHSCIDCGSQAAEWSYNHADPNELTCSMVQRGKERVIAYSSSVEFYEPRCKACHTTLDRLGV